MPLSGLELTYRLAAVGVRLGEARARITPDAGALQVSLSAQLTGVFAKLGFGRLTQRGRHPPDGLAGPTQVRAIDARDDRTITYDQHISPDGRSVRVTTERSDRDRPRRRRYRRQGLLTDPVGLLLGLRTRKLQVGDRACAEVIVGNRVWRLSGQVKPVRVIQTPAGRIRATHIQGTAHRTGRRAQGQAFSLWLSDDAWRLPVRFWLDGPLGGLTLDLVRSSPLPGS